MVIGIDIDISGLIILECADRGHAVTDENVFELAGVSFSYLGKFPALDDITLNIKQGDKISVIGANGSGKSTLLCMLDALIFPDTGGIKAFGVELNDKAFADRAFSADFRKRVGLVFQNPDIQLFCPTVKEDIMFGPLQLGVGRAEIMNRLERLTDILDIGMLLDRSPHQLSVGEKRRIALASTLIIEPEVLILDEPTAGLDPLTTRRIIDVLIEANAAGKTIITSTHDLHIVEEISDTVYVFSRDKRIVASGRPDAILEDMELLRANNLVHIHRHAHDNKSHAHPHLHLHEHPGHRHGHGK